MMNNVIWDTNKLFVVKTSNEKLHIILHPGENTPNTLIDSDEITAFCKYWLKLQKEPINGIAPCPNCRDQVVVGEAYCRDANCVKGEYQTFCQRDIDCGYRGPIANTEEQAIHLHNLIANRV